MRKSIKRAIAVVSALAMAMSGVVYTPVSTSAADTVTWKALGSRNSKYNTVAYIDEAMYATITNNNPGYEGFYDPAAGVTPPWNFDMGETATFGFVVGGAQRAQSIIIDGVEYTDDRINFSNGNNADADSDCFFINQELLQLGDGEKERIFTMELVGTTLPEFQIKIAKAPSADDYEWTELDYASLSYNAEATLSAKYAEGAMLATVGNNPIDNVVAEADGIWILAGAYGKAIYVYINGVEAAKNTGNSAIGYKMPWSLIPTNRAYNDITILFINGSGQAIEYRYVIYNPNVGGGEGPTQGGGDEPQPEVPNAPLGLVVGYNKDANTCLVQFAAVDNATSYNYYIDGQLKGTVTNGGTFSTAGLAAGTYSVQITAVNAAGESALSAAATLVVEGAGSEEPTDPTELVWSPIEASDNLYYAKVGEATIVNVQNNGWTGVNGETGPGVYFHVPGGISSISVNGQTAAGYKIEGAGALIYLTALTEEVNEIVVEYAPANKSTVYIKSGATEVDPDDSQLNIKGYQANVNEISAGGKTYEGGIRVVYNKPQTVEGVNMDDATDFGLIFGNGLRDEAEMVVGSTSSNVRVIQATNNGVIGDGQYAVTMATNFSTASVNTLSRTFTVRSYAVINGVTYYSDIETFTEISVLKAVYETAGLNAEQAAKYLAIIKKVDPSYAG